VRAFNLIKALCETKRLDDKTRLAVIGKASRTVVARSLT
jgi:hypothetical protein